MPDMFESIRLTGHLSYRVLHFSVKRTRLARPQTASDGGPCGGRRGASVQPWIAARAQGEAQTRPQTYRSVQTKCEAFLNRTRTPQVAYLLAFGPSQAVF